MTYEFQHINTKEQKKKVKAHDKVCLQEQRGCESCKWGTGSPTEYKRMEIRQ